MIFYVAVEALLKSSGAPRAPAFLSSSRAVVALVVAA